MEGFGIVDVDGGRWTIGSGTLAPQHFRSWSADVPAAVFSGRSNQSRNVIEASNSPGVDPWKPGPAAQFAVTNDYSVYTSKNLLMNTSDVGSGAGVIALRNAQTVPSVNPSAGVVIYAENGALKCRGASGTVTVLGPA